jgi:hypothetical protein
MGSAPTKGMVMQLMSLSLEKASSTLLDGVKEFLRSSSHYREIKDKRAWKKLSQDEMNKLSGLENTNDQLRFKKGSESTILHEIQHEIQDLEGFAGGTDMSRVGFDNYNRSAGEAEARAVANRMNMSDGERYVKDTRPTYYHGTTKKFDKFDKDMILTKKYFYI